jgi:hypothetical protein
MKEGSRKEQEIGKAQGPTFSQRRNAARRVCAEEKAYVKRSIQHGKVGLEHTQKSQEMSDNEGPASHEDLSTET